VQRIHAVFFHQGAPALGEGALRTDRDLQALRASAAAHLSPAGHLQVATALDMLAGLEARLDVLRRRLPAAARSLSGARVLAERLYGVGPVTGLDDLLAGRRRPVLLLPQGGPVRRAGRHRLVFGPQGPARAAVPAGARGAALSSALTVSGRSVSRFTGGHGVRAERLWCRRCVCFRMRERVTGDLGERSGGVQPQGQGGMPQVVRAAGQRRGGQLRAECDLEGGAPDAAVGALAEDAAAGAAEQPPVRHGPGLAQVLPEQIGQDRRDRHFPDSPVGTVLEATRFVWRAGAGPC